MSYNESLSAGSNYPPMSQGDWDRAPWNEPDIPLVKFDVLVSQTLSKSTSLKTDQYIPEYVEEDGSTEFDTSNVEWENEYHENDHYMPSQLIEIFKNFLENVLTTGNREWEESLAHTKHLFQECCGWSEDETEVIEE